MEGPGIEDTGIGIGSESEVLELGIVSEWWSLELELRSESG